MTACVFTEIEKTAFLRELLLANAVLGLEVCDVRRFGHVRGFNIP